MLWRKYETNSYRRTTISKAWEKDRKTSLLVCIVFRLFKDILSNLDRQTHTEQKLSDFNRKSSSIEYKANIIDVDVMQYTAK
jgi:hypothetical protein